MKPTIENLNSLILKFRSEHGDVRHLGYEEVIKWTLNEVGGDNSSTSAVLAQARYNLSDRLAGLNLSNPDIQAKVSLLREEIKSLDEMILKTQNNERA